MSRVIGRAAVWFFAAVLSIISVVVAAVIAIALVYDWNDLRAPMSRIASTALGRKVVIGGDLDVDIGWTTRVKIDDLAVANATWAREPQMVQIARVDAAIDVWQALQGHIRLPSVALDSPRIFLARNQKGQNNWTFGSGGSSKSDGDSGELPIIEEFTTKDALIRIEQPDPGNAVEVVLDTLTLRQEPPNQDIRLSADGQYQKQPLRLRLEAGSFAELRGGGKPFPLKVDLKAGNNKALVSGSIGDPAKMQNLDLAVDFSAENAADLYPLLGLALPPTPPYHIKGQLTHQKTAWSLADFEGTLGGSDLRGSIAVDLGGARPKLTGDLRSNKLDFADLLPSVGAPRNPQPDGEVKTSDRPGRVLPDKNIDLSRLRAMDADVTFRSSQILTTAIPLDRFDSSLTLDDGTLRLQPVSFEIGKGRVDLYMSLYGSQEPVAVDIDARVNRINLRDLLRNTPFVEESAGILGGRAKMSSTGTSVADILGNANGETSLVMSGGKMSLLLVELAGLDIAESLGLLVEGDKTTPIRCLVAELPVKDGVFQAEPLVLDTGDTVIIGSGDINMKNETLGLTMRPYAKDFSPLTLRTPISIGGTFASPEPFPDPTGTGNRTLGEKILNAVLMPFLGVLPPFDTEVGKDTPCTDLVDRAKQAVSKNAKRG